jgi:hypothetical protein
MGWSWAMEPRLHDAVSNRFRASLYDRCELMPRMIRNILPILVVVSLALLTGCSTFNPDWKSIAQSSPVDSGLEGRWKGIWHSDATGHEGDLRCIISRDETDTLLARYHAKYGGFLTFEYKMPMSLQREGDTYRFAAQADLGWLAGGLYEYEGTVVGDAFNSTYTSKSDHGTFQMQRLGSDPSD